MPYSTTRSEAAYLAAQEVIAGGVNSGARGPQAGWVPGPPVVARGAGARLWDVDGNEYLDYLLALGPMIHGHAHPEITERVTRAIHEIGTMFALPYELEAEAARKIVAAVPSVELVRFGNSGTEVVLHATRLARAFTGRTSWSASRASTTAGPTSSSGATTRTSRRPGRASAPRPCPARPGIPEVIGQTLAVLPWNDQAAVERLVAERGREIAAILTEPIMGNTGVIPPQPGYLAFLREITAANGIVLIFDEVITGFRVALGGAQALYGVTPTSRRWPRRSAAASRWPPSAAGARSWTRCPTARSSTPGPTTPTPSRSQRRAHRWTCSPGPARTSVCSTCPSD